MASGLCVRVLLLSLLMFGWHAKALSYRSGGSGAVPSYFDLPKGFLRSHKPASAPSTYESSAQPEGPLHSFDPSYTEGVSSEYLKPAAALGGGHYTGTDERQVDGYSPEGSVSSYRPGSLMYEKPRENPQQPKPAVNVMQTKDAMWDFAPPQSGFESGVASSYEIEMRPARYPSKPQQPSYPSKPQQPSYPSKPQQPSYPALPRKGVAPRGFRWIPSVYQPTWRQQQLVPAYDGLQPLDS